MRGGLRTLSRRGSGVRIPAPAPNFGFEFPFAAVPHFKNKEGEPYGGSSEHRHLQLPILQENVRVSKR